VPDHQQPLRRETHTLAPSIRPVNGYGIGQGDYITISLNQALQLSADSTYGFAIAGATGYAGLATDTNAADYTGGMLAEFQPGSGFGGTLITNSAVPQSVFDVSLTPTAATPEPAAIFGMSIALGTVVLVRRRRKA
ncbi:MAG: PEP-CTERM sorting domain-containing protein, partial [Phycisphaerae bacterium]